MGATNGASVLDISVELTGSSKKREYVATVSAASSKNEGKSRVLVFAQKTESESPAQSVYLQVDAKYQNAENTQQSQENNGPYADVKFTMTADLDNKMELATVRGQVQMKQSEEYKQQQRQEENNNKPSSKKSSSPNSVDRIDIELDTKDVSTKILEKAFGVDAKSYYNYLRYQALSYSTENKENDGPKDKIRVEVRLSPDMKTADLSMETEKMKAEWKEVPVPKMTRNVAVVPTNGNLAEELKRELIQYRDTCVVSGDETNTFENTTVKTGDLSSNTWYLAVHQMRDSNDNEQENNNDNNNESKKHNHYASVLVRDAKRQGQSGRQEDSEGDNENDNESQSNRKNRQNSNREDSEDSQESNRKNSKRQQNNERNNDNESQSNRKNRQNANREDSEDSQESNRRNRQQNNQRDNDNESQSNRQSNRRNKEVLIILHQNNKNDITLRLAPRDNDESSSSSNQNKTPRLFVDGMEKDMNSKSSSDVRSTENPKKTLARVYVTEEQQNGSQKPKRTLRVETKSGDLEVRYDGKNVEIRSKSLLRKNRGICGAFTGQQTNDLKSPQNKIIKNGKEFAASWAVIDNDSNADNSIKQLQQRMKEKNYPSEEILYSDPIPNAKKAQKPNERKSWANRNQDSSNAEERRRNSNANSNSNSDIKHGTKHQTQFVEDSDNERICFSKRPLPVCPSGSRANGKTQQRVEVVCRSINDPAAQQYKKQIKQGRNLNMSAYTSNETLTFSVPKRCEQN